MGRDPRVWQWTGFDDRPDWVLACTTLRENNDLVLDRRSGRQLVYRGECLEMDADGQILHRGASHAEPV
jgi:hypothetical protein